MNHRQRRRGHRKTIRPRLYDEHHRKARGNGGDNSPENISNVRIDEHIGFHRLFGIMSPKEIAKKLSDIWIDPEWKLIAVKKWTKVW